MLFSFFITQWMNPIKGDWTELVKKDLKDFEIESSFDYIRSLSRDSFKNMVKKRARKYAFEKLKNKQMTHSKMKKLEYNKFTIQGYLNRKDIKLDHQRTIFKYRTRMEVYGENYREGRGPVDCILCGLHLDSQELIYQCPKIKTEINPVGSIDDVYKEEIDNQTIENIVQVTKYRRLKLENDK